ncbi:MAG: hypothetical protein D6773_14460, partial [Alphaproteobacteria bacterium]
VMSVKNKSKAQSVAQEKQTKNVGKEAVGEAATGTDGVSKGLAERLQSGSTGGGKADQPGKSAAKAGASAAPADSAAASAAAQAPASPSPDTKEADAGEGQAGEHGPGRRQAQPARARIAANDDLPSIGGLIYALQQRPSRSPFLFALGASVVWLLLGGAAGWALLTANAPEGAGLTALLQHPSALVALATVLVPIALFWFLALLVWRAQELRLMASAMTEVAIRLAEPDKLAEQSVASLGQTIRRQVAAMNDAISRALGRAGELEALVHSEVAALENSYGENELRIRRLIEELASEREALANNSERVSAALRGVGSQVSKDISTAGDQATKALAVATSNIAESLTAKSGKITAAMTAAGAAIDTKLAERGVKVAEALQETSRKASEAMDVKANSLFQSMTNVSNRLAKEVPDLLQKLDSEQQRLNAIIVSASDNFTALETALSQRTSQLDTTLQQRGEELKSTLVQGAGRIDDSLKQHGQELRTSIESGTARMDVALQKKTDELKATLAERIQALDSTVASRAKALDEAVANRAKALDSALANQAKAIDTAIAQRAGALDAAVANRTKALDATLGEHAKTIDGTLAARAHALEENLSARAHALEQNLETRISALDESLAKNTAAISQNLTQSTMAMNQVLAEGLDGVKQTSAQMAETSARATGDLNAQAKALKDVSTGLLNQIHSLTQRFEKQGQAIMTASQALDSSNARIDSILERRHSEISSLLETVSSKAQALDKMMRSYTGIIESSLVQVEARAKELAANLVQESTTQSRATIEEIERLRAESYTHTQQAVQELQSNFQSIAQQVAQQLNVLTQEFGKTTQEMRGTATQTASEIEATRQEMQRRMRDLPQETRQNTEAMRKAVSDQLKALGALSAIASQHKSSDVTPGPAPSAGNPAGGSTHTGAPPSGGGVPAAAPPSQLPAPGQDTHAGGGGLLARFAGSSARSSAPAATPPASGAPAAGAQQTPYPQSGTPAQAYQPPQPPAPTPAHAAGNGQDDMASVASGLASSLSSAGSGAAAQATPSPGPEAERPGGVRITGGPPPASSGSSREGWSVGDLLARASQPDDNQGFASPPPATGPQRAAQPAAASPAQPPANGSGDLRLTDLARALDQQTAADIWQKYQRGERGILSRHIYSGEGQAAFDEISSRYQYDPAFRDTVNRYLSDFEQLLGEAQQKAQDPATVLNYLTSETGRVYLMLAHASGRLN